MIGLRTQRSSAPTEGPEDVTAFSGPSKTTSARGMNADRGDVSGTEERRYMTARADEGVFTAPQGLRCAEKRTELESEVLLRMDSRNEDLGDVLMFSRPSETILVKEITSENVGESERVKRVSDYPLTVSNKGTEDVTTSSGLSEMTSAEQSADRSEHSNARLQNFGNTAEPKTKKRYESKRRSLFKQQLRTCRLVFVALILLSLLGHVNADAPASSHMWDFRNCVAGQDVLDTGVDLGKTASPIHVSTGLFGGGGHLFSNTCCVFLSGSYLRRDLLRLENQLRQL